MNTASGKMASVEGKIMTLAERHGYAGRMPTTFLGLQKSYFVLAPIHTKAEYKKAMRVASDLASREQLTRVQADYLEVLTNNIVA